MAVAEAESLDLNEQEGNDRSPYEEQLHSVFSELYKKTKVLNDNLASLRTLTLNSETESGLSWLEVKNQMLLGYLNDTNHVVYNKLKGKSIANSQPVARLVELRTVLERMRPVDHKLRYEITKMTKLAHGGRTQLNDPLMLKAHPDAFDLENDADQSVDETSKKEKHNKDSKGGVKSNAKYVPLKLAPVHYFEDEPAEARLERHLQKAQRRALSSSIIAELRNEYHDGPMEVREEYNPHKERLNRKRREREKYEEENFVRLQVSRKERHENRLKGFSALDDITKFSGPRLE